MTLGDLADALRGTGCSVHVRAVGDKFVVVAHSAQHTRAGDCSDADLAIAIDRALEGLGVAVARAAGHTPIDPPKPLRKRSEARR